MSTLPSWASDPESLSITEEQYDALPDQVRKVIEVIDGNVILCQSGSPEHSDIARRLANRLEAAKPDEPCLRVSTDVDVYYMKRRGKDEKLSFRTPDVSVYRCVPRGQKIKTSDVLAVVEVVSPGSGYTDTVDKLAEYAHEGIAVYLVVHLDAELYIKSVHEYRLDWASRTYRLAEVHAEQLSLDVPFPFFAAFSELDG